MLEPANIEYIGRHSEPTKSVLLGDLDRKSRASPSWSKAFLVLTPSGFLHDFPDGAAPLDKPTASLFLPSCSVGTIVPRTSGMAGYMILVEGKKQDAWLGASTVEELEVTFGLIVRWIFRYVGFTLLELVGPVVPCEALCALAVDATDATQGSANASCEQRPSRQDDIPQDSI
ncbi:hypothetical protein RQP46_010685 [Phenoliferia psychrophenolica]